MRAILTLAVAAALAAGSFLPFAGRAADMPTASQIERALTGGAASSGMETPPKTRGIRPGMRPEDAGGGGAVSSWMRPGAVQPREANLSVPFATGSAEVSPSAARVLDELGAALTRPSLASGRFRIEGHTDTVGSAEANRALSERRAAGVVAYLARRHGIDRARLDPVGMGQEGLLVPTGPGVAEPRNRRVLVVNVGG